MGHTTNLLIASLPRKDREHLLAGCKEVDLVLDEELYRPLERMRHIYFPVDSFISLIAQVDDHARLEVTMIGNEGMLGIPLMLGANVASLFALVQGAGPALQMSAATFILEIKGSPPLRRVLDRYAYVLMSQFARTAACTRFHMVPARLARWLLMTQDRAGSDNFQITHEFLAYMLGVRRVSVTKAASELQRQKFIRYRRGDMTILNRSGLEAASCGCYASVKATHDRIMG